MLRLRNTYVKQSVPFILLAGCFLLVLSGAAWRGYKGRVLLQAAETITVARQSQAAIYWEKSGVRGRILLLFDAYPHMRGLAFYEGPPTLTDGNFVEYAIFKNIARKIYLIVADDHWQEFAVRRDIGVFRELRNGREGLYLFTMSGVPLLAVPASRLATIDEKVLVYVNDRAFSHDQVRTLLNEKKIQSDIFMIYQGSSQ